MKEQKDLETIINTTIKSLEKIKEEMKDTKAYATGQKLFDVSDKMKNKMRNFAHRNGLEY